MFVAAMGVLVSKVHEWQKIMHLHCDVLVILWCMQSELLSKVGFLAALKAPSKPASASATEPEAIPAKEKRKRKSGGSDVEEVRSDYQGGWGVLKDGFPGMQGDGLKMKDWDKGGYVSDGEEGKVDCSEW
jgi:hypothetical protein